MNHHILLIEDDLHLQEALADNLVLEGFTVSTADTVAKAKQAFQKSHFDLIILDIMLPDGSGYDFSRWIRSSADTLILMLSARTLEKDIVEGFISGCDDYVNKPYRINELLLRIKALLRRQYQPKKKTKHQVGSEQSSINNLPSQPTLTYLNNYAINWELREITYNGNLVHLTKTAFDILSYLFKKQNSICSRDAILDAVWGQNVFVDARTVDNFVSNLKKQLQLSNQSSAHIKTVRGIGYYLSIPS